MGWETVQFVEIDEFCQKVLKKNFPNVPTFGDITQFDGTKYKGTIDILSGGFPCQPFSVAGQRKGKGDDRYLWEEMLRVIAKVKPTYVVCENVTGIISLAVDTVLSDLEAQNYTTETFILPACAVNANHRRDRVWIIAYSKSSPRIYENQNEGQNAQEIQKKRFNGNPKSEPSLLGGTDGIPDWMDRIKGLGNAIVPQVALEIFKAIEKANK
jgi:DNA (cytosine-5)-methyltransferase 1